MVCERCLTKKAEPPPTRDVNRDSGTDSGNGGWLRRLVRLHSCSHLNVVKISCCSIGVRKTSARTPPNLQPLSELPRVLPASETEMEI